MASGAKDLTNSETSPESKKAEVVQQVDPNDPLQHFNQPYYRHRRRVARRCTGEPAGRTAGTGGAATTIDEASRPTFRLPL